MNRFLQSTGTIALLLVSASCRTWNLQRLIGNFAHSSNPWTFVYELLLENRFGLPPVADNSVQSWLKRIALWQFAYGVHNGDGEMKEARLSRYLLRQRLRHRPRIQYEVTHSI